MTPAEVVATLTEARKRRGWTMRRLGREIDRPAASIFKWEKSVRDPGLISLSLWAEGLGYKVTVTEVRDPRIPIDPLHLRRMWADQTITVPEMGRRLGASHQTVRARAKELGLEPRKRGRKPILDDPPDLAGGSWQSGPGGIRRWVTNRQETA